jgi:bacteriocin biosynthesis cyclodehydratase domain-containing protein
MTDPGSARFGVIGTGRFGAAVQTRLVEDARFQPVDGLVDDGTAVTVVVGEIEDPAKLEEIDDQCAALGRPWLPVTLEPGWIRVGPTVVAGATACYHCFRSRSRQHDPDAAVSALIDAAGPVGPLGYAPPHVDLVASLVVERAGRLAAGEAVATGSEVLRVSLFSCAVAPDTVTGVHGCRRCGDGWTRSLTALEQLAETIGGLRSPGQREVSA